MHWFLTLRRGRKVGGLAQILQRGSPAWGDRAQGPDLVDQSRRHHQPAEGLLVEGISVPLAKLCAWFGVPRRTIYYKPTKAAPKVDPRLADPIKVMIEAEPSFGYRTVAWLLGFNKNTVQRIFQIKGWQVRKRPIGMRPRIEALPSVATTPNERWSTDLCRVWAGRDGWTTLALVIDCLPASFWAGISPDLARPRRLPAPWSTL
jgi:transposase InsO family protein